MYSGIFTHYIKPVLSMPQIEKLFGLLGYQSSSSLHEQLRLQSPRVSPDSVRDLLCLACAFFLARCECCLLLTALGKHFGEAQWELNLVRERQKGNSLQVCLPGIWRWEAFHFCSPTLWLTYLTQPVSQSTHAVLPDRLLILGEILKKHDSSSLTNGKTRKSFLLSARCGAARLNWTYIIP